MQTRKLALLIGAAAVGATLVACGSTMTRPPALPLPSASPVDLPAFMGRWYVIASIPTFLEKGAVDAVETYTLRPDGSIDIDFRYRRSPGGSEHQLGSRGFVQGGDNAVWGVQFIWPIKADYRIAWLAPQGGQVIVARQKRDYVWIMARTPTVPDADYQQLVQRVGAMGYDTRELVRVPQSAGTAASR
ncbi:lipocalin family protein [Pseudorhodoferax sp. Leaf267]|uniref:lipocalin family protein n=1 Tax=Pseudorhodoferax sp. Leaf267 TaxID=1736316 RepID=UPI0006F9C5ED|nr:lipocalin family protein [Pseudorhodoferax sp. Leaf267]KQP21697.1 hypothetical protein ASF43_25665 [Pseudorhodoferax sp. Leaf267]